MSDDDEVRGAARRFNVAFDAVVTGAGVWLAVMFIFPVLLLCLIFHQVVFALAGTVALAWLVMGTRRRRKLMDWANRKWENR
jgi:hypothetical protein